MAVALLEKKRNEIICGICDRVITPIPREIPVEKRQYKADMVIKRDAYWNDAGIFSIIRTRQFFHKTCFEKAVTNQRKKEYIYNEHIAKMVKKGD